MILIEMSNREKAGIILSRTSEPTDLGPILSERALVEVKPY